MAKKSVLHSYEWKGQKADYPFDLELHEIKESYSNHRHSFLEFFFVIEGTGTEVINGKAHPIKPGSFTLILPYQVHAFHAAKGEIIRLYNCAMPLDVFFGPDKIGADLNGILFSPDPGLFPFVQFEGEMTERILRIFKEMEDEYQTTYRWSRLMFKSKVAEILILFDRVRRSVSHTAGLELVKSDHKSIWEVVHYLFNHYQEDISLNALARLFFVNPCYLSTQFKQFFGKSYKSFLNEIRILHVCSLLSSTDLPVTDIAFSAGFKSYSSFCRVFLQNKGVSATEFKKLLSSGSSLSEY